MFESNQTVTAGYDPKMSLFTESSDVNLEK